MTCALGMGVSVVVGAEIEREREREPARRCRRGGRGARAAGGRRDRDVRRLRRKSRRPRRRLRDRKADAEHHRGHDDGGGCEPRPRPDAAPLQDRRLPQARAAVPEAPAERAAADRHLDGAVRRRRQPDGDAHPQHEERDPGQGDVEPGARHQEHGPMPQVDAVRAFPDPDHRRRGEQPARDGRGRMDGDEDDQRRDAGEHEIPPR